MQIIDQEQLQRLFQYASALSNQRADAMDILQNALMGYLNASKESDKKIEHPEAFIRTSIRNHFIDQYRAQGRWPSEDYIEGSHYDISPIDIEALTITQNELDTIWNDLEIRDRDILYHWAVLGYSLQEVSDILGFSKGTLLSRIHRLRKKLHSSGCVSDEQRRQYP